MSDPLALRLDAARRLAEAAATMALSMRPPPGAPAAELKSAQDWVTQADGAVEAFLSRELATLFPEDGFRGEEAGVARPGRLAWVVDPIDGTSNFSRGGARWCVSIGLLEGRTALLGVLAAPALGEVFVARLGHGATLNGVAIRAAATAELGRATVECGWSPRTTRGRYLAIVDRAMAAGVMVRAGGSGALGLADVACGRLDGYVEAHINLWDVAGVLPVLAEAGAVEHGFLEGAGFSRGGPILAAAPGVAGELRRVLDGPDVSR